MTCYITLAPEGLRIPVQAGQTLLEALREHGLAPEAPCGGNGKCGKCTMEVSGEPVLSCQYIVTEDITVGRLGGEDSTRVLTQGIGAQIEMAPLREGCLAAFDIGTTTVVCYLMDGKTGEVLAVGSAVNPQESFGADVISRIQHALSGSMEDLTNRIRRKMTELLENACAQASITPDEVGVISFVGNPCMQQLFLGIPPQNLAQIPFDPVLTAGQILNAGSYLPGFDNAALLVIPDISGYVGADTVGCVLAADMDRTEQMTLMVDIGTNGEMVLGDWNRMTACATAAGPALEGARILFGMRGSQGAIDHVWLENNTLKCSVIGDGDAVGICGSGLIDAIAVLADTGLINHRGRLVSRQAAPILREHLDEENGQRIFRLTDGVYLTQEDIREVQMAKGAIAAGIELMAAHLGISTDEIQQVLLAGAFGSCIRPESACRIGLLPPKLLPKIRAIGNAAGSGACRLACNRFELARAQRAADRTEYLELASLPDFQKCFARNMMLSL